MKTAILLGLVMAWVAAGLAASPVITLNFNDDSGVSSLANSGTAGGVWTQGANGSRIDTVKSPNNTTNGFVGSASGGTAWTLATNQCTIPTLQSITIGGWVCRTGGLSAVNCHIFGNMANALGFSINVKSNTTYRFMAETTGGQDGAAGDNGTAKLDLNVWTFIAMTYDGNLTTNNVKYYTATSTNSLVVGATASLNKGPISQSASSLNLSGFSSANGMPGMYDDMRIYISTNDTSGILSQSEITTWMQSADVISKKPQLVIIN